MNKISFRNMQESDLALLHDWLNRPHMRMHYQPEPISLEMVIAKYSARLQPIARVYTHIVLCDDNPIGKMQCYLIQDWAKYASEIGVQHGISLDLFIGDANYLGKGIGAKMLGAYIKEIVFPLFPSEDTVYICHEKNNLAALATSLSVGFQILRSVLEEGKESTLLLLSKSKSLS